MKMRPLEDRVVIKPALDSENKQHGIIIPDTAKEKPQKGEIVAVGPGKKTDSGESIKMTVKAGDIVLFGKYSGTDIQVGGEEYLILRESDILAIL